MSNIIRMPLADMASRLANPQVRNQGTIGGNICYADPATDPPSCLMALDASLVLSNARGDRVLPIADFLIDYYTTALAPDEIVSEIRVPPPAFDIGYHARFLRTAAEHRPLVNLAVTMKRDQDIIREVRLVVGATTTVPTRVREAETFLEGKTMTNAVAAQAADIVAAGVQPISDIRGSEAFRRDMVRVVARRTIERLCGLQQRRAAGRMSKVSIEVVVNGITHRTEVPARRLLADFIRDDLFLTGTKRGCETGVCGACSVLMDGEVVKSCLSLAVQADGHEITTVEGLSSGVALHPVQEAFVENGGFQCGYCTPGFLMASIAILNETPNPTEEQIRAGLSGNLCRCTGYVGIVESIMAAAEKIRGA